MCELKIPYDKINSECGLYDLLKGEVYVAHLPELYFMKGKGLMFKRITLKNENDYYILYSKREKPYKTPKIIRHYQRGRPKAESQNPSSITIKFNNMYHLVGDVFVFV